MKIVVKERLVRSRLKSAGHVEWIGDETLEKRADELRVGRKGGEEDRHCDGKTALRKTWGKRRRNKGTTGTVAHLTPEDRDAKRRTTI